MYFERQPLDIMWFLNHLTTNSICLLIFFINLLKNKNSAKLKKNSCRSLISVVHLWLKCSNGWEIFNLAPV